MRRAAKTDANHAQIVHVLKQCGCSVLDLSSVGAGCPDLLVGYRGRDRLVEVKDGAKKPSERKLRDNQAAWHYKWRGQKPLVIESVDDAMDMLEDWL